MVRAAISARSFSKASSRTRRASSSSCCFRNASRSSRCREIRRKHGAHLCRVCRHKYISGIWGHEGACKQGWTSPVYRQRFTRQQSSSHLLCCCTFSGLGSSHLWVDTLLNSQLKHCMNKKAKQGLHPHFYTLQPEGIIHKHIHKYLPRGEVETPATHRLSWLFGGLRPSFWGGRWPPDRTPGPFRGEGHNGRLIGTL